MSGTLHHLPFKHYHRKEDGSVYFSMWGQLTSAPDESPKFHDNPIDAACKFDLENAIPVKEWESGEVPPLREVERALGLPLTLTPLEKVRDAINAMKCEWHSDYDYPDFLSVYPAGAARSPAADDDGVAWSFGLDIRGVTERSVPVGEKVWVGNDRNTQNTVTFPYGEKADPAFMAGVIVKHMRETALKRIGWLNAFVNSCVCHIERTSGTSPASIVGPWAGLSGGEAYDEARSIIATWEGSRA